MGTAGTGSPHVSLFLRQLGSLIQDGVGVVEALRLMEGHAHPPGVAGLAARVGSLVGGGAQLREAMASQGRCFPAFLLGALESAERSGLVAQCLVKGADELDSSAAASARAREALVYPAVVLAMMGASGYVLYWQVVPSLAGVYASLGLEVPPGMKLLMGAAVTLERWWPLAVAPIVGCMACLKLWGRENGMAALEAVVLKLPVAGRFLKLSAAARFASSLEALLSAGVRPDEALRLAASATGRAVYRERIQHVAEGVAMGGSLAGALAETKIFPALLVEAVRLGERSGTFRENLRACAAYHEREFQHGLRRLISLLGPLLTLAAAAGVLWVAVSVLVPVYRALGRMW